MTCTELQIVNDLYEHKTNQTTLFPTLRTSIALELGMGPEYSCDIAGDGPRKRTFVDDNYDPELERVKKRRKYNSRRIKADIKAQNEKRSLKSDTSGKEYDISSPFPPTAEQLRFTGMILGNSVAALFAQQTPPPEISYAAFVAEQLRSYTQPIIDFTINQFKQECCDRLLGDVNFAKAAANKALNNLEKIVILNNHYQLMWDFTVWDIYNPPSLSELELLSKRHPYQPISELLREEIESCKKIIHSRIESIRQYREIKSEGKEDCQDEVSSQRYCYPLSEKYSRLE